MVEAVKSETPRAKQLAGDSQAVTVIVLMQNFILREASFLFFRLYR